MERKLIFFLVSIVVVSQFCLLSANSEEKKDIEKEVTKWIEFCGSCKGYYEIERDARPESFATKYGMEALPVILKWVKTDNPKVKYGCYRAINEIVVRMPIDIGKRTLFPLSNAEIEKIPERIRLSIEEILSIAIQDMLNRNLDSKIRIQITGTLQYLGTDKAISTLQECLKDPDPYIRLNATSSLRWIEGKDYSYIKAFTGKEPTTPQEYAEFLSDTVWRLYPEAASKLEKFGKDAVPVLIRVAKGNHNLARIRAIEILGRIKSEEAIPVFIDYLKEDTKDETMYSVQLTCISALFDMDTENSIRLIEEYGLGHKNPEIRYFTVEKIYRIINPISEREKGRYPQIEKEGERLREKAKGVMRELMKDGDNEKRYEIGIFLLQNKEKEGIPILIGLMKEKGYLRKAKDWLEEATGQKFGEIPPIVSKKMIEEYIKKWEDWWEKNKETFKFPEEKN